MPLDGGPVQRVTSTPWQEWQPTWSPDGSALAYGGWRGQRWACGSCGEIRTTPGAGRSGAWGLGDSRPPGHPTANALMYGTSPRGQPGPLGDRAGGFGRPTGADRPRATGPAFGGAGTVERRWANDLVQESRPDGKRLDLDRGRLGREPSPRGPVRRSGPPLISQHVGVGPHTDLFHGGRPPRRHLGDRGESTVTEACAARFDYEALGVKSQKLLELQHTPADRQSPALARTV